MTALAGDEMRGRGSATPDELRAAHYIAAQLKLLRIKPAGDDGGYLQTVKFQRRPRGARATAPPAEAATTNVIGILRGKDPSLSKETILLSAHLDHLGVREGLAGDNIFNGADDDASGVTAVLELAEALAKGKRPKRTVVIALFGSEEIGGWGARYFQEHPPVPLESFVANLEFEMIGRADPAVPAHTLWLTGYERSDLGPQLAAHGARLVADPHPEQNFFRRSDNYVLARKGIIAQTVSSYGLHGDYHRPSDDLAHIDFAHMTEAISSMIGPVKWLVNTNFKPQWTKDGKPS
jgi:Zn-dependent M28 family amino/carboxypeptidase